MSKLLIALLVAMPMVVSGEEIFGTVAMVHDGDTITLETNDHRTLHVRLAEIDAPERAQPWGDKATKALEIKGHLLGKDHPKGE